MGKWGSGDRVERMGELTVGRAVGKWGNGECVRRSQRTAQYGVLQR